MTRLQKKSMKLIAESIIADAGHLMKLAKEIGKHQDLETAYRLRQCGQDLFHVFAYLDAEKYDSNNFRRWA